jgi:hypothetical protein
MSTHFPSDAFPLSPHGSPGGGAGLLRFAPVGVCDSFIFRCRLRPESSQEHLPTSIAEVLRLRAIKPCLCDRCARRFAQDDNSFEQGVQAFPGEVRGTADPSASLGMTKERVTVHSPQHKFSRMGQTCMELFFCAMECGRYCLCVQLLAV